MGESSQPISTRRSTRRSIKSVSCLLFFLYRNIFLQVNTLRHFSRSFTLKEVWIFIGFSIDTRDYKSVLYEILEESYKNNPYYVPIMENELESVKKTLQFMVDKEGHIW